MSPKRTLEASSDDEFRLSDKSLSPQPSRLKRPRRRPTRDQVPSSLSPRDSSFQDEQSGIIDLSGSVENDNANDLVIPTPNVERGKKGNLNVDEHVDSPKEEGQNSLLDELSRDAPTDPPSPGIGGPDVSFLDEIQDENSRVAESVAESLAESVAESIAESAAGSGTTSKAKKGDDNTLRRRTKPVRYADSDSEVGATDEEDGKANDDDDAYNSLDDSDDNDDDAEEESDFEPSPKKATRKKESNKSASTGRAARGTINAAQRKTGSKVGKSTRVKLPLKNSAVRKNQGSSSGNGTGAPKTTSSAVGSNQGKRLLGARIPVKGSTLNQASGDKSNATRSAGSEARPMSSSGKPAIRSGLSRKASVPRLHSYLAKK